MWHAERQNVYELEVWQQADAFATLLREVCCRLELGRDKAWLIYLLQHVGQRLREAIEEGWNRVHLAECLLGFSEALTLLTLVDYYLIFLRHEGYLAGADAEEVDGRLRALQDALTALAGGLRETLRARSDRTMSYPDVISDSHRQGGLFVC